jgi:hypothetical protein
MAGIRKKLTARRVSLGFILLLAATMFLSTCIPQEMDTPAERLAEWRRGHQVILWLVDGAHLQRIYAQPWFAIIILCAAMSLGVSTRDQLVATGKRKGAAGVGGVEIAGSVAEGELRSVARMLRYRPVKTGGEGRLKFCRNPWGYYGNALLHLGMVLSVCASLYVALTGKQGALVLVEGAATGNGQSWINAEQGMITTPLKMPGLVRLDRLTVGFDAKNQPVAVSSAISIVSNGNNIDRLTATINGITNYRGMRIYHSTEYGDAFTLEFNDEKGNSHYEKLLIQQPAGLDLAGYGDFALAWSAYTLSAKYLADAEKRSMTSANPLLTLRLLDGKRELTRLTLTRGASGELGRYRVRLIAVEKWSKLIFVDITGMPVIFAGFAVIMLGGIMHYIFSPRELIGVRERNDRFRVYWKAPSFGEFYEEERDRAAAALHKGVI